MLPKYEIVRVPFRGDAIDAIKTDDGKIMVSILRVCESLDIDPTRQTRKLVAAPWACTDIMSVQVGDQRRNMAMIDHESLPMWLVTISPSKVKASTREKLVRYQREAKAVLSAWFLGSSPIPGLADEMKEFKDRLAVVEDRFENTRRCLVSLREKFDGIMGTGVCTEFLTLREFVDTYKVYGILGTPFKGSQLRVISRHLNKLSQVIKAEVRKVSHPAFGSVNAYRFDVLQGWLAVSNISNATSPEDFGKLVQGRLFV